MSARFRSHFFLGLATPRPVYIAAQGSFYDSSLRFLLVTLHAASQNPFTETRASIYPKSGKSKRCTGHQRNCAFRLWRFCCNNGTRICAACAFRRWGEFDGTDPAGKPVRCFDDTGDFPLDEHCQPAHAEAEL